jgi:hypothetical protein
MSGNDNDDDEEKPENANDLERPADRSKLNSPQVKDGARQLTSSASSNDVWYTVNGMLNRRESSRISLKR